MNRTILVLGARGQVARALAAAPADFSRRALGSEHLDLRDLTAIGPAIAAAQPDIVINAAAYTAVDKAESDQAAAFHLNRDAPGEIARICAARAIPFIHISTDFVFDGLQGAPYLETDRPNPQSVYGRSKAEGEDAVRSAGGASAIVRTSWVYAAEGANFVRTMLLLGAERGHVRVVADQRGRPTRAADLANALLLIARRLAAGDRAAEGVFHYANSGEASWADFAEEVLNGATLRGAPPARVERIATADYPTAARRPPDSRLDCTRFTNFAGAPPPDWRVSLAHCLDEIFRR